MNQSCSPVIMPLMIKDDGNGLLAQNNNEKSTVNEGRKAGSVWKQILAAIVAQLGTINTGMVFGFSAIAIPQLQEPNSTIPITMSEASWIGMLYDLKNKTLFIFFFR